MSNSRSFRRAVKGAKGDQSAPQPWNKGLAMTSDPSDSTTGRWLKAAEEEGVIERTGTRQTGKPGRPPVTRDVTEKGRDRVRAMPPATVLQERLRRQENARKRGKRGTGKKRLTQADFAAVAGMMISATGKLILADGDASALHPDEVEALLKYRCAHWEGGVLVLNPEWLEDYSQGLKVHDA